MVQEFKMQKIIIVSGVHLLGAFAFQVSRENLLGANEKGFAEVAVRECCENGRLCFFFAKAYSGDDGAGRNLPETDNPSLLST